MKELERIEELLAQPADRISNIDVQEYEKIRTAVLEQVAKLKARKVDRGRITLVLDKFFEREPKAQDIWSREGYVCIKKGNVVSLVDAICEEVNK